MTTETDRNAHARENAQAALENIRAMVARLEHARDCKGKFEDCGMIMDQLDIEDMTAEQIEAAEADWRDPNDAYVDFDDYHDEDAAERAIHEDALSVEVRSGWCSVDGAWGDMEAAEFRICLTTGGPELWLRGELDGNGEPSRAWLEFRDWGTSFEELVHTGHDALIAYARAFYFGEGGR